ncbi:ribosomal RNA small subunit methyltransferase A [Candidatus Saccharibacteria bacterium CG_4_9_14_0_2_um_filter_41_9]|nr:MAG: ribosomal RNA small subunit methyltransferase A [Candidatus Saccharibacteria bacterium CG2_30_41_52]PJC29551.1 MAG: ribosomal RNA small subunit methyltransferase A [Candidatus Saccharibacteria bacterium CG_4_9_14_0_2_um_filter_41_9]PJE66307.1 MAG: ribosomal RNA small subunit methyltransferase A [Candidatus Saccharibacteria bacterium CG10_big_fil_rev_8_21_14_0_10_41_32]
MALQNDKSLGQHWLRDRDTLAHIVDCAELNSNDTVLEIGPGLGTLTSEILRRADRVVAVEFDSELARKLPSQFPGKNLKVITGDILKFDLSTMPVGYKVVANVPYYITSKIVQTLMTDVNKPSIAVLLVQKEVAERLAAKPGQMSILAVSAQLFAEVTLGDKVPAVLFTPPPKVDSQVVILKTRQTPFLTDVNEADFFRIVKAGFSAKRKKLRSSLSGGLKLSKPEVEEILGRAGISPDNRAETLSLDDWVRLTRIVAR